MKTIKMTYKKEWQVLLNEKIIEEQKKNPAFRIKLAIYTNENDQASTIYIRNKQKYAKNLLATEVVLRNTNNKDPYSLSHSLQKDIEDDFNIMAQQPFINEMTQYIFEKTLSLKCNANYDVEALSEKYQLSQLASARNGNNIFPRNNSQFNDCAMFPSQKILPCTVSGNLKLLEEYLPDYDLKGKLVLVVGRSAIVGQPIAELLESLNCTVIHANSYTANLDDLCLVSDMIISCAGVPNLIKNCKPGAVLIDNGCSIVNGHQHGDIDKKCWEKSLAYTPWVGATGKATVHCLFENAFILTKYRASERRSN